ncbi:MAG: hypothetical protein ABI193_09860, partial [Minicystis sp.]
LEIRRHWQEHRPRMVRQLGARLDEAVYAAEQLTLQAEAEAVQAGSTPDQARELYREEWAFLPSEEDAPDLPHGNPAAWRAPANPASTTGLPITTRSAPAAK